MRDPERIDPFLEKFAELWKKVPDWRFGQLIMNLTRTPTGFADPWDWEESDWEEAIREYEVPPEPTDEEVRLRAEAILKMINLDPGGRDSFE